MSIIFCFIEFTSPDAKQKFLVPLCLSWCNKTNYMLATSFSFCKITVDLMQKAYKSIKDVKVNH